MKQQWMTIKISNCHIQKQHATLTGDTKIEKKSFI